MAILTLMASHATASFEAVLFDFHDTLFRFPDDAAWLRAGTAACGWPLDEAQAAVLAGQLARARRLPEVASARRAQDLSPQAHRGATARWLRLAGLPDPLAGAMYEYLVAPDSWQPFADTAPVLRALRDAGIAVGVLSNTGWDLRGTFAHQGLLECVGDFALSCELGLQKPDGAIFERACARLAVHPRRTLMVGDNPQTDGGCVTAGLPGYLLPGRSGAERRGLSAVLRLVGVADEKLEPNQADEQYSPLEMRLNRYEIHSPLQW